MKRFVGVLLWSCFLASAQQNPSPVPVHPAVHVHVYNTAQSNATAENAAQIKVENTNTQIQEVTQIQQPSLNTQLMSAYSLITQYIKEHWLLCTVVATGTLYVSLIAYLWHVHYRIYHAHMWSV